MHLVRLFLMGIDLLEKEEIITYREKEQDLLLKIRHGYYQLEDGSYSQDFFDLIDELESKFKYASENTSLPDNPDMNRIEDFVMSVNERVVYDDR